MEVLCDIFHVFKYFMQQIKVMQEFFVISSWYKIISIELLLLIKKVCLSAITLKIVLPCNRARLYYNIINTIVMLTLYYHTITII